MMWTRLSLVILAVWCICVIEGRRIKFRRSSKTIDLLLARAGNMKHNIGNRNGRYESFGKRPQNAEGVLIEYDIMVKKSIFDRLMLLQAPDKRRRGSRKSLQSRRNKRATNNKTWPGNKIPFVISNDYDADEKEIIRGAIDEFNKHTCLQWVDRVSESSYVNFNRGDGCWSYVGKSFSSAQPLSLGNNCLFTKVIIHEMMHAAGCFHEQSREDRDQYVTVNWDNIQETVKRNFEIRTGTNTHGVPYNYRSIMHYSPKIFSSNGKDTLTTKDPAFQDKIGQSQTLSKDDILLINRLYQCDQSPTCISLDVGCNCGSNSDCSTMDNSVCSSRGACTCPTDYEKSGNHCVKKGPTCATLDIGCSCGSNSDCSSMDNSVCSSSGACTCPTDYEKSGNDCVKKGPTCTTLDIGCNCGSNSDCSSMDNSICSSSSACTCPTGYEKSGNNCVKKGPTCTTLDAGCNCGSNLDCSSMNNAICSSNGACTCPTGYEKSGNNCVKKGPACTKLDFGCSCGSNSDCSSMDKSVCSSNGACTCPTGYEKSGNNCIKINTGSDEIVILDGSTVSPFTVMEGKWRSRSGSDTSSNGIPSNGKFLYGSARSSSAAPDILESPTITGSGLWCLSLSGVFRNTQLTVTFVATNQQPTTTTFSQSALRFYTPPAFQFSASGSFKVEIKAEPRRGTNYRLKLDNVKLAKCSA